MTEWIFVETWSTNRGQEKPESYFRPEIKERISAFLAKKNLTPGSPPVMIGSEGNRMSIKTASYLGYRTVIQSIETDGTWGTTRPQL